MVMELRVQRENEEVETIVLVEPVTVIPAAATLWRLQDAAGIEHYFTEDGYYDGYGSSVTGFIAKERE